MTWDVRLPVFRYRRATEEKRYKIAEQVPKHNEHDGPCPVSEGAADFENSQVEEQDSEFISEEADQIYGRRNKNPLACVNSLKCPS